MPKTKVDETNERERERSLEGVMLRKGHVKLGAQESRKQKAKLIFLSALLFSDPIHFPS